VATAIILQYTAPVWLLLYVVARGQQKLSLQKVAAVGLAVTGIALVIGIVGGTSTGENANNFLRLNPAGLLAALLASFSFAFYKHCRTWRPHPLRPLASAALDSLLLHRRSGYLLNPPWKIAAVHYAGVQWAFLFVFSMISVLGAFSLYFLGLQHLEPTRAIIASCLEPVFSILLAAALLGEMMHAASELGDRAGSGDYIAFRRHRRRGAKS